MKNRILSVLLVCLLLPLLPLAAYAHSVPDENLEGSICVTMKYKEEPVPGGELTLFLVGEVEENDGNYNFVPTEKFSEYVSEFDDIYSPALAQELALYAKKSWAVDTQKADKNGIVTFSGLHIGLYLVVQTNAADGYEPVDAFLVSVPRYLNGEYIYDVDASSKMDLITTEPTDDPPTETTKPGGKLPQTGQLNWPVPVLASIGMVLFACGMLIKRKERKENQNG